ncbi:MAG TPA: response regulator [Anaerolineaceae bacterium]|nr:response regulator [Anaerolineaceae bacterium]
MTEPKTILHIEDNFDNRLLVRRLLMAEGYRLVEAENAGQALETLVSLRPDLILMDINMPEMDGYTLTRKIKEIPNLATVPVIAITANVMKGDREKTIKAGCDGYIDKPIDVDRFTDQVAAFLRLSK